MIFPNNETIIQIIYGIRQQLFPCHFPEKHSCSAIKTMLSSQIEIALESSSAAVDGTIKETSQKITDSLFEKLDSIKKVLDCDAHAGLVGDPAANSVDEIILAYPGFFAVTVHRISNILYTMKVPLIPRLMSEYAHSKTGIDIHPGARIAECFFIDHGTGVVIGETTKIGKNVKIYQGVTLGAISTKNAQTLSGKKRHPTIGNNVTIYAGATILGGETIIGDGATIGGNVFITKSVPPENLITGKNSRE